MELEASKYTTVVKQNGIRIEAAVCPYCGTQVVVSRDQERAKCPNCSMVFRYHL